MWNFLSIAAGWIAFALVGAGWLLMVLRTIPGKKQPGATTKKDFQELLQTMPDNLLTEDQKRMKYAGEAEIAAIIKSAPEVKLLAQISAAKKAIREYPALMEEYANYPGLLSARQQNFDTQVAKLAIYEKKLRALRERQANEQQAS